VRVASTRGRTGTFRALDFVFDIKGPHELVRLFDDVLADLSVDMSSMSKSSAGLPTCATIDVRRRRDGWTTRCKPEPARHGELGDVVADVIQVINQRAARSTAEVVAIHAAVVATSRGVVALMGGSGAGKSTLAAAAVRHGLGYVADEVAVIGADHSVRAFHRPIGIRSGGAAAVGIEIPLHADGRFDRVYPWRPDRAALAGGGPLIGVCVVEHIDGSDGGWVAIRPAEALIEMAGGAFGGGGGENDRAWFRQLADLVRVVPVARLTFPDPVVGVEQLTDFVGVERQPA
jgi:hypothetical protein